MPNLRDDDVKIIIALDDDIKCIDALLAQLNPKDIKLKVGKEMFTRYGPEFVKRLVKQKFSVFLDLKFHDIPNTVARACRAAADLGVWMLNVHASGGAKMLEAAHEALAVSGTQRPLLIAVTVLTSFKDADLQQIGCSATVDEQVMRLARLATAADLDGIVCSAADLPILKTQLPPNFIYVTPGIRPTHSEANDQQRIMTPSEALNNGASYLVIGRPITRSSNPAAALKQIQLDIQQNFL